MHVEHLPGAVRSHLLGYTSDGANLKTESCADVFHYTHPHRHGLFLKVRNTQVAPQESDLLAEKTAMSWLQGKLKVPRVVCFHEQVETQYMVTTQVAGVTGIHQDALHNSASVIRVFAHGLREIHSINIDSCPLDWRMERYLLWAGGLIDSGALDSKISTGNPRIRLKEELASIRASLPTEEDLVFTHGDYCLPNILLQDDRLSGIIDWGYAGVGDRYLDFVAACYTIRRNLGSKWVPVFFEEYGLQQLDGDKLMAYKRLYDFVD